jgi:GTP-binding protein
LADRKERIIDKSYLAAMNIVSARYIVSSPSVDKCPPADKPEYAFIGRSNVGKSSLINMLCRQQNLAKTSATPGKTQMINHFLIQSEPDEKKSGKASVRASWYITDLPGYGYAKVTQTQRAQWKKMIEKYLRERTSLVVVFVLIDARHKPQENDLSFIRQLGTWKVPFAIVFTKSDKEKQAVVSAHVKLFLEQLQQEWESLPPHFITSAIKQRGRKEMLAMIEDCNLAIQQAE